jgi:hypothetical protein
MTATRRTVLSGISTGLASLPALATLPSTASSNDDTELLELGRELEIRYARVRRIDEEGMKNSAAFRTAVLKTTGMLPENGPFPDQSGYDEFQEAMNRIRADTPISGTDEEINNVIDRKRNEHKRTPHIFLAPIMRDGATHVENGVSQWIEAINKSMVKSWPRCRARVRLGGRAAGNGAPVRRRASSAKAWCLEQRSPGWPGAMG